MIFETERLLIRKLVLDDLYAFHELESNPLVLKYATGEPKVFNDNRKELIGLISKYKQPENDFWIYAIERKSDKSFIGTVALVKDDLDDEIGYRFLEEFWKLGYGSEVCVGLISYSKQIGLKKITFQKSGIHTRFVELIEFVRVKTYEERHALSLSSYHHHNFHTPRNGAR